MMCGCTMSHERIKVSYSKGLTACFAEAQLEDQWQIYSHRNIGQKKLVKVIDSILSLEAGLPPTLVDQVSCGFGQVLESSKDWDCTVSPGNLFQGCATLLVKTLIVMSNLNLQFVDIPAFYIIHHLWEELVFLTCFWHIKILTKFNIYSIQHSTPIHTDCRQVFQGGFALGLLFRPYVIGSDFQEEMLHDVSRDWGEPHLSTVPPPRSSFLPCLKIDSKLAFF